MNLWFITTLNQFVLFGRRNYVKKWLLLYFAIFVNKYIFVYIPMLSYLCISLVTIWRYKDIKSCLGPFKTEKWIFPNRIIDVINHKASHMLGRFLVTLRKSDLPTTPKIYICSYHQKENVFANVSMYTRQCVHLKKPLFSIYREKLNE